MTNSIFDIPLIKTINLFQAQSVKDGHISFTVRQIKIWYIFHWKVPYSNGYLWYSSTHRGLCLSKVSSTLKHNFIQIYLHLRDSMHGMVSQTATKIKRAISEKKNKEMWDKVDIFLVKMWDIPQLETRHMEGLCLLAWFIWDQWYARYELYI